MVSQGTADFCLEELAAIMLPWVLDAANWASREQSQVVEEPVAAPSLFSSLMAPPKQGMPVLLHIYDVSQDEKVQKLNRVLAHAYSPLKLGGVFHAGVEVLGLEWSYGCSENATVPGISCNEPKEPPIFDNFEVVWTLPLVFESF